MKNRPKKARTKPSLRHREAAKGKAGLPAIYWEAYTLAEQGRYEDARRLYETLLAGAAETRVKALVANDLATLAALEGRIDEALDGWRKALETDATCLPSRLNRDLANAELALASHHGPAYEPALVRKPAFPLESSPRTGPIRVAILSFLFNWPSTGGGTVHTFELARFLARTGYEVRHIYARFDDWGLGQIVGELPYSSEVLEFQPNEWNLPTIQSRFRRAVEVFDPDQVIITDSWNIKPLLAAAVRAYPYILRLQALECLCPLNNVRLLVDEGSQFRQCPFHQLASPAECSRCLMERGHLSGALHQAERELCGVGTNEYYEAVLQAFRGAEAVLVVNPLAEAMISPYAKSVKVVTAGIDPARFPWPAPESPRGAWAEGRTVLLFAGLVDERMKGFHVLRDACGRLWEKRKDFVLAATADPPGDVDEFTRYVGWQSQADLPRQFQTADVLVFPTIAQEGLGRTAVESMAAGKPVVASRIGGLPFTVIDGATGLLCEPGDPADLARKLETLLDDPEQRRRMGEAGRRRFEEHYAWDVIVERHYKPILTRRDRSRDRAAPAVVFSPHFPEAADRDRLLGDAARLFDLPPAEVGWRWRDYMAFHDARQYDLRLGELKTLCLEEAFVLSLALERARPATVVEVGTQQGKSTRRILDMIARLGLDCRVACFDVTDEVCHFRPGEEAELVVGDVTGRFRRDVLEAWRPGLIYLDVHAHGLLREAIAESLAHPDGCIVAIHDCGRGLYNPRMAIAPGDPGVGSGTGVWERHLLAEAFGVDDPLDPQLDDCESPTHRLTIFDTRHGLGVLVPHAMRARWGREPAPAGAGDLDPALGLPRALLADANHPEPIEPPPGLAGLVTSSSPQNTLYRLVQHARPRAILEIGTQLGASAVACALAMRDSGIPADVVCVDPFLASGDNDGPETLARWYAYVAAAGLLGRGVRLILATAREALPLLGRRFDLILVDGSHAYEDARHDIEASLALASPGGWLWIHDYVHYDDVRRAADEVIAERGLPHGVNVVQRNDRGDLCGWCLVRNLPARVTPEACP
jgi:glycosyltransferase involved in cell wall biosynthesis/predicted O-methyltransferase YrrM